MTMRYANRTTRKAILVVGGNRIPVVVDAYEIINLRDRRGHYEGHFWSNEMPTSVSLEEPLSLVFPNGDIKAIRVFSQLPTQTNPASNPSLWEFFEASFMAESNMSKN